MGSFYGVLNCFCMIFALSVGVTERSHVVLMISFDAFRYDYVNKIDLPKIKDLQAKGSHAEYMINVFETKTFPNHQSIATGLYSESHGVIANSVYDPKLHKNISYSAELYEMEGVLPIWTLNEMAGEGRHSGVMMWPGGEFPYGNITNSEGCNGIYPTFGQSWNQTVPWEERVDTVMDWITHNTTPTNLVMLYFEQPDAISHVYGPDSKNAEEEVKRVDNILVYLCDKISSMNLSDIVNVIVVSDHGMQTVNQSTIINLPSLVNTSLYTTPSKSPILHINPLEGFEGEVFRQLNAASANQPFAVYRKEEMPERWHIKNSPRTSDIVLVADDGYVFDDFYGSIEYYKKAFNVTPSPEHTYGVHGYDNALDSMHPFFLAWGPRIKKGFILPPFDSIDLFPLVIRLLNLPLHPSNGTIKHVESMLVEEFPSAYSVLTTSPYAVIGGIAVLVLVLIGGAGVLSIILISRRRRSSSYERQLEQCHGQDIFKGMVLEEQRLLSDSDEY